MADQQPTQQLSPEQEKAMGIMLKQAMGVLTEESTVDLLLQKAQSDPKAAILDAVVPLLKAIYGAAQQAGAQVEFTTLLATGLAIILKLAELLASEGIIEEQQIPTFSAEVAKIAVEQHNASVQKGGQSAPTGMLTNAPVAQGA